MKALFLALGLITMAWNWTQAAGPRSTNSIKAELVSEKENTARKTVRRVIAWQWKMKLPLDTPKTMPFYPSDRQGIRLLIQP